MRRREFIAALGGAAAWPLVGRSEQLGKVWRVGLLSPAFREGAVFEAFRQQMKDLGYIEGKNLIIESRYAEGYSERLPSFANELVAMPCDVIVAVSTPAIAAAQRATSKLPIVMSPSADPLGSGFVKSLGHPGGNTTGVAALYGEMTAKSIEYLQAIVPNVKKIAVLMSSNPLHPSPGDLTCCHHA
jgi:putative tryptophan/tyrosine transport system substrate-binding protein